MLLSVKICLFHVIEAEVNVGRASAIVAANGNKVFSYMEQGTLVIGKQVSIGLMIRIIPFGNKCSIDIEMNIVIVPCH